MKGLYLRNGVSADALLLILIKLVTSVLGFAVTRLLSQYLTVYDYGTYSQILMIVSAVSSLTIFGMMDSINFFYSVSADTKERENIVAAMFTMQCVISAVAGVVVLALSAPLCAYFDNPNIRRLLLFAIALPMLQNLINMMQVLMISVGKAKLLAVRNFVVSAIRLLVVLAIVVSIRNVVVILLTSVLLDIGQIAVFCLVLKRNGFTVRLGRLSRDYVGRIIRYCAPMATFIIMNNLNRDMDKYLIARLTDTETLAMYANASKLLPFEIVISSFSAVLLPKITQAIVTREHAKATKLYRVFLEISYVSTAIMCCAALSASPQLMVLLYTKKYLGGLSIFRVYILVDLLRFTNITMVLAAAGKTRKLMVFSIASLMLNAVLNIVLFRLFGMEGPAIATLTTTLVLGICIMSAGAKELETRIWQLFDGKFALLFLAENALLMFAMHKVQRWLDVKNVHYMAILAIVCGTYGVIMLLLNGKRLLRALKQVDNHTNS